MPERSAWIDDKYRTHPVKAGPHSSVIQTNRRQRAIENLASARTALYKYYLDADGEERGNAYAALGGISTSLSALGIRQEEQ